MPNLASLDGFLFFSHDRLHEVDIDGLVCRQVKAAVDSKETKTS